MWCQMEANGFPNTLAGGRTAGPWPSKEIKVAFSILSSFHTLFDIYQGLLACYMVAYIDLEG